MKKGRAAAVWSAFEHRGRAAFQKNQSTNFNLMKQIPYKSLFPVESNRVYFLESEYLEIIDKTCVELEKEMNNYTIEQSSVLNQNVLKDEEEINRLVDEAVKKDP
ncbi:MAG: hypothetical protein IKH41_09205, partial [Clostridia bacterium]|nr:hypothetical protein [Clostridia bacterium]